MPQETQEATPFVPQQKKPEESLPWAYRAGLIGSNLFDAGSTSYALNNNPRAHEAGNMASTNPFVMYPMKAGLGTLEGMALDRLSKAGHPRLAKALSIGAMAVPVFAGIHNVGVGRK